MDNNINYNIQNFYEELRGLIANSNLPISVTYYLVKDIFRDLEITFTQVYEKEAGSMENGGSSLVDNEARVAGSPTTPKEEE